MISSGHNTSESAHRKHTKLERPGFGLFGRNEWAFVGGICLDIKLLSDGIIKALANNYKCAYIDAAHLDDQAKLPSKLNNGAIAEYTDHQDYTAINYAGSFDSFKKHEIFSYHDLILINGNHHQAKAQVVILSPAKIKSLEKRVDQLTNVQLFLLEDEDVQIFDFIKQTVPDWQNVPVYQLNEMQKIIKFFEDQLQLAKPVLNGLVLAGGKSTRMGTDKATLNWHGKEQQYYLADLLAEFCDEVYISCRPEQRETVSEAYQRLSDTFTGLGPFGAILSAFREKPDHAWLVVACDLPLIDHIALEQLIKGRKTSAAATAFKSTFQDFPEPLITIWEPKSYPVLLSFLAQGYSCPRKVLINSDVKILEVNDVTTLINVNTPEEMSIAKALINRRLPVE